VIALQERVDANARVRLLPWGQRSGAATECVVLADEPAFAMELGNNPDPPRMPYATPTHRWSRRVQSSMSTSLPANARCAKEQVVIGYDRSRYASERAGPSRATARDPGVACLSPGTCFVVTAARRSLSSAMAPTVFATTLPEQQSPVADRPRFVSPSPTCAVAPNWTRLV